MAWSRNITISPLKSCITNGLSPDFLSVTFILTKFYTLRLKAKALG